MRINVLPKGISASTWFRTRVTGLRDHCSTDWAITPPNNDNNNNNNDWTNNNTNNTTNNNWVLLTQGSHISANDALHVGPAMKPYHQSPALFRVAINRKLFMIDISRNFVHKRYETGELAID